MNKQEQSNELYPVLGVVTSDEIISIDNRIKSCMIENPEEDGDEYYAKIWFSYKDSFGTKPDGRYEFIADTKEKLIKAIQDFMDTEKEGWCIV
jgi:hypothetical protein